jgi:hypothetical protein
LNQDFNGHRDTPVCVERLSALRSNGGTATTPGGRNGPVSSPRLNDCLRANAIAKRKR